MRQNFTPTLPASTHQCSQVFYERLVNCYLKLDDLGIKLPLMGHIYWTLGIFKLTELFPTLYSRRKFEKNVRIDHICFTIWPGSLLATLERL